MSEETQGAEETPHPEPSVEPNPSMEGQSGARLPRFPWRRVLWGALELSVLLLIVTVASYQRVLELERVEVGGDALKVWEFARNLVLGGDFPKELNHHTSRFGLVIPAMLAQALFGPQATSYFVAPVASSVALSALVYLIGRKLSGPFAGVVGALSLLAFEPMVRASSQILPEGFGPTYVAFAMYAALVYSEAESRWARWLALSAVGFGIVFAYGAKAIYLFYAPGLAFLVWFGGSKGSLLPEKYATPEAPGEDASWKARLLYRVRTSKMLVPGVLTCLVLLLVVIESVFLSSVTDASSRLAVVEGSHGGMGAPGPRIRTATDFFALYTRAPSEWVQALTGGAIAWLGLVAFARDKRSKLIGLAILIFFLLQTFIVRRLDPLTPWLEPHPRYLLALGGPLAIALGVFVGDALGKLGGAGEGEPLQGRNRAFSLLAGLALVAAMGADLPERWDKSWGKTDAVSRTQKTADELSAAFAAGLPILSETPQGKPARAAVSLFIDPQLLLDKRGKPIHSDKLSRKYGNGRYAARAVHTLKGKAKAKHLDNAVGHRLARRDCLIQLRQSVRFVSGRMTFNKDCVSLEDEFKRDSDLWKREPKRTERRTRRPSVAQRRRGKAATDRPERTRPGPGPEPKKAPAPVGSK